MILFSEFKKQVAQGMFDVNLSHGCLFLGYSSMPIATGPIHITYSQAGHAANEELHQQALQAVLEHAPAPTFADIALAVAVYLGRPSDASILDEMLTELVSVGELDYVSVADGGDGKYRQL